MNFNKALVVYRKEILEVLRDKRTLFTTLILPVILYPLLIVGFNSIMARQTGVLEKKGASIAVQDSVNNDVSLSIIKEFESIEGYTYLPYSETSSSLYESKDIQAIVTLSDSLATSGVVTYKVTIQYDASNERGRMIFDKLRDVLRSSERRLLKDQLELSGMNPDVLNILGVRPKDTSTSQKKMGMILGMFLPYIMIIMLLTGASVVAADLVAGEKERKTLETLLVSGIGRNEIVFGKYLTIISLAMLNLLVNLFSISFSLKYMLSQTGVELAGTAMPIKAILILLAAMLPLATFFAAILLSISTFSRNMKEARTYEQPLMMISMMMAMISFLPAVELNNLMALIPVINISLLFKAVMIDDYQIPHLLITIGSTILLDVAAIWATIRLFNTEGILFRSDDDSGSLKGIKRDKGSFFNPYNGMVYYTLALVLLYYLGSYLQKRDLAQGIVQTQLLIILLPVLLVLRLLKQDRIKTLRFKLPRLKEIALIPFIAIPCAIIMAILAQFINTLFPFPDHYLEQLSKLFKMDIPNWYALIVIALLPGICEEIMFRGFIHRFYERYGAKMAVVTTSILFAAFHLDPFRFIPVLLLGLLLGYLTVRSGSIINSMFSHSINNGFAFFLSAYATHPFIKPFIMNGDSIQNWLAIPAIVVFLIALITFHRVTGENICVE